MSNYVQISTDVLEDLAQEIRLDVPIGVSSECSLTDLGNVAGKGHVLLSQPMRTTLVWSKIFLNFYKESLMWDAGAVTVNALQNLWVQWSQSTPDLAINLAGWKDNPNWLYCPCYNESWGGVLCIDVPRTSPKDSYNVLVIGL